VPARGEVTTISVSRQVAERLRSLREKLGAGSWDELLERLADGFERSEGGSGYEDALEALSALYRRARELAASGDFSELEEFVVWVERRLSPLIAKCYEEAKVLLQARGEDK
jgi:hypothetical protein